MTDHKRQELQVTSKLGVYMLVMRRKVSNGEDDEGRREEARIRTVVIGLDGWNSHFRA